MNSPVVSAILVAAGEPADRLMRAARSVAAQSGAAVAELIVAVPPVEVDVVRRSLCDIGMSVCVISNPDGRRSAGLNIALAHARGDIICRIDARSRIPSDYVKRGISRLSDPAIGVVGGVQSPTAASNRPVARGIARALSNPFALGGAAYRRGRSGPADTVYLGIFRKTELIGVGGWNERLDANEDFELCSRYRDACFVTWVEGDLPVEYEARSTLRSLFAQYHAFGESKLAYWCLVGGRPVGRQILALGGAGIAAVIGAYVLKCSRRAAMAAAGAGVATVAALDAYGAPTRGSVVERSIASLSYVVIWTAWLSGIGFGAVRSLA